MRRFTFFKLLILLVVCVTVLGFWRGWFTLSEPCPDDLSNKVDVRLSVDPDKANKDAEEGRDRNNRHGKRGS